MNVSHVHAHAHAHALGRITKFVSPSSKSGYSHPPPDKTPTVIPHAYEPEKDGYLVRLRLRYSLLSGARDLLINHRVTRRNSDKLHRTVGCHYWMVDRHSLVDCVSITGRQSAIFSNVMKCSSVWSCPVCAAKISERRRIELQQALDNATAKGLGYALGTFTLQHCQHEDCKTVLTGLNKSYQAFWGGKTGVALRKRFGIVGQIKALEVTLGKNGWHCHLHTIFVFRFPPSPSWIDELRPRFTERWQSVLARNGRYAHADYGFHITSSDRLVADYVAKWGDGLSGVDIERVSKTWTEAHELTKAIVKTSANKDSKTPNQLIADSFYGDKDAGVKWVEYVKAFTGSKQLKYSPGLKALLEIKTLTDEEIAEEQDDMGVILAQLNRDQWALVVKQDIRGELQSAVATGDYLAVKELLDEWGVTNVYYPDVVNAYAKGG